MERAFISESAMYLCYPDKGKRDLVAAVALCDGMQMKIQRQKPEYSWK
jgi:hypothetical protein